MKLIYKNKYGVEINEDNLRLKPLLNFINSNRISEWIIVTEPYYKGTCDYRYNDKCYSIVYHKNTSLRKNHIDTYVPSHQIANYWAMESMS